MALVVAKAPVPGRVKTRLAAAIGDDRAVALARATLLDTLDACRAEADVVGVVCADERDVAVLRSLAGPDAPVVAQAGAGLADALVTGSREALRLGGRALLVSADVPGVPRGALLDAARGLDEGADVVLGPGHDGGYWLVGLRALRTAPFEGVPWSTPAVLETTLARCRAVGLAVRLVAPWRDLDTVADLDALAACADRLPGRRTAALLHALARPIPSTEEGAP